MTTTSVLLLVLSWLIPLAGLCWLFSRYAQERAQNIRLWARIAELEARPAVDVRAFGAAGDGVTDDTDAIQAALDTGSIVQLSGTHVVRSPLHMRDGQTVRGQGTGLVWGTGPSRGD